MRYIILEGSNNETCIRKLFLNLYCHQGGTILASRDFCCSACDFLISAEESRSLSESRYDNINTDNNATNYDNNNDYNNSDNNITEIDDNSSDIFSENDNLEIQSETMTTIPLVISFKNFGMNTTEVQLLKDEIINMTEYIADQLIIPLTYYERILPHKAFKFITNNYNKFFNQNGNFNDNMLLKLFEGNNHRSKEFIYFSYYKTILIEFHKSKTGANNKIEWAKQIRLINTI